MPTLRGVAGRLIEDYFCKLPGMDHGLAIGGALGALDWAVDGRCRIRAPTLSPENTGINGVDLWEPVVVHLGLAGSNSCVQIIIEALNALLAAVDPSATGSSLSEQGPASSIREGDDLFILASREVTGKGYQLMEPALEIVEWLRAIRTRSGGIVVRMNEEATKLGWQLVRGWFQEEPWTTTSRIRRWTNVAALLALGADRLVTADLLMQAHEIAIVNHELAASKLLYRVGAGGTLH